VNPRSCSGSRAWPSAASSGTTAPTEPESQGIRFSRARLFRPNLVRPSPQARRSPGRLRGQASCGFADCLAYSKSNVDNFQYILSQPRAEGEPMVDSIMAITLNTRFSEMIKPY